MNKDAVISKLIQFRERLLNEVVVSFEKRGSAFGRERFNKWTDVVSNYLDEVLPGEANQLQKKLIHFGFVSIGGETDAQEFWRTDGENMLSYIDSLIIDLQNDEYKMQNVIEEEVIEMDYNKVFIVHGHDNAAKQEVARFVENLGLEAIILHEQTNGGKTIIEKIEEHSNVGYAIVLYTSCDLGKSKTETDLKERARQNVVFEHGYLIGKIGRGKVTALVKGNIEKPNDISGVVYIELDNFGGWKTVVAKEMRACGYNINLEKLL